jgi:hypothetical protein
LRPVATVPPEVSEFILGDKVPHFAPRLVLRHEKDLTFETVDNLLTRSGTDTTKMAPLPRVVKKFETRVLVMETKFPYRTDCHESQRNVRKVSYLVYIIKIIGKSLPK